MSLATHTWETSRSSWRLAAPADRRPGEEAVDLDAKRWWGDAAIDSASGQVLLRRSR